ncbi:MAG: glucose 1-dehydrogenase [Candidatus Lambdaproteobacteria bacterium]|nr:glucose 1-dehydrogenase [Candidatus Lambdaproteobacteria bacterium]
MRGLRGKAAIVTGSGSGIGRAIARRLAEEGCRVGVFDLNPAGATETVAAVRAGGGEAFAHTVDIADGAAVTEAVRAFEAEAGPTEILVNNAGWDRVVPFLETDTAFWKKVIDINLYGPLNMHHAVLPGMVQRRRGRVISISSDAGRVGSSGESVYSACKGGIIAFTKTMARELARSNIQLNTVCPGPTDTPLLAAVAAESATGAKIVERLERAIPMRRLGRPEDYPGIVAFLASDDAAYITGQTISVSGGLTMNG